jgi:hypothetical protein
MVMVGVTLADIVKFFLARSGVAERTTLSLLFGVFRLPERELSCYH